jgi:hypothetical protein
MSPKPLVRRLVALVVLCCALTPAAAASAADDPVPINAGAGADWGVKASFRSYVVGPIAHGSITVDGGASVNVDGTYHFPVQGGGAYDALTGATVVRFGGSVHFVGHDGQLDLKISDPRVELTADGPALYADVASKTSLDAAAITQFPNVRVAAVDLTGKTPTIAGGTTTWTGLPQTLTAEAAPAFAGFYTPGTALDPVTFGYDGPGGAPQIESWSQPGLPQFGKVATAKLSSGTRALGFDPTRNRVWSSEYNSATVTALGDQDLGTIATVNVDPNWDFVNPRNVAVDRTSGDVYVVDAKVRRVQESGGVFTLSPTDVDAFPSGASNALAGAPDGTVYTVKGDQLIGYKGGVRTAYTLPQDSDNVAVLDDGTIVVYGQFLSRAIGTVTLSGATATVTDIPGTTGINAPAFTADGSFYYVEQDVSEYPTIVTRLWHVKKTSGGWDKVAVPGITSGLGGSYVAATRDGKTVYVSDSTASGFVVVHDGKVAGTVAPSGLISDIEAAPNGDVYAVWRGGDLARFGQTGTTPSFTKAPADVTVAPGEAATFTAAADGDAAPTIAWQVRQPGETRWSEAGTGETFTIAEPQTGVRVRAVATNAVGAVASDAVSAVVATPRVDPPVDPPVDGNGGGTPTTTTPAPDVQAPPVVTTPTATVRAPALTAPKSAKVGGKRLATVATLRCGTATCTVSVPKSVKVKIGGRTYKVAVTAPKRVAAGKQATVRVKLTAAAYKALRGRKATAKVKVVVTAGGKRTTRTAAVSLKR